MKRLFFALLLLLTGLTSIYAQDTARFERRVFHGKHGTLNYRLLRPMGYGPTTIQNKMRKQLPLVVFLHGSGERGSDNGRQLIWGGKRFADSVQRAKYPAWVIFPQCPAGRKWSSYTTDTATEGGPREFTFPKTDSLAAPLQLVSELIDSMLQSGTVDEGRVYLGGLSMGAIGAYDLLWHRPNTFAGAILICGGGRPELVANWAPKVNVWIFHGDKDGAVNVAYGREMAKAIGKVSKRVKYTEYWGIGHNSWDYAFAEPELFSWLFANDRSWFDPLPFSEEEKKPRTKVSPRKARVR